MLVCVVGMVSRAYEHSSTPQEGRVLPERNLPGAAHAAIEYVIDRLSLACAEISVNAAGGAVCLNWGAAWGADCLVPVTYSPHSTDMATARQSPEAVGVHCPASAVIPYCACVHDTRKVSRLQVPH